jgi:hypothetical protein
MRLAQYQKIAGLGDVLRRGAPMHPAAIGPAGDPGQFPDQRHDRVAGAREPLVDPRAVEQFQMGGARDRRGRALRDDPQLLLRLGERRLDIEPGLPAVFQAIERANAGVGHTGGSWEFVTHGSSPPGLTGSYSKSARRGERTSRHGS